MCKPRSLIVIAAAAALLVSASAVAQVAQVPLKATTIPQFVQELPRLLTDIPVVGGAAVDISMCEFQTSILPAGTPVVGAVPGVAPLTWVWGYEASSGCPTSPVAHPYIGPVILAYRDTPTQVTYHNKLGDATTSNVLAYQQSTDQTLQWADPLSLQVRDNQIPPQLLNYPPPFFGTADPEENNCNFEAKTLPPLALLPPTCGDNFGFYWANWPTLPPARAPYTAPIPAAPHLHGGEIPPVLDGGPDAWWTSDGIYAHGYYSKGGFADAALGKAVYTYPNVQDSAPTWFHDHVLGATRLNVYAGIAGAYYQIDPNRTLPAGMHEYGLMNGAGGTVEVLIPLVIQDRMFDTSGQLFFPNLGINPEHPYWVPEFVGDVIVVNGKAWPKVTVEPKRYRFLVLNGSNARAYELFLINPVTGVKGPTIWVIGNDQGYLDAPVAISPKNKAPNNKLIVMPGERYEIIVDFAGQAAGTVLELRNTAQTPYPGGSPAKGSTTAKIVQFAITGCTSGFCGVNDASYNPAVLPNTIRGANPINRLSNPATGAVAAEVVFQKTRRLTLNEFVAAGGPMEILVNNTTYIGTEGANVRADFQPIVTRQWKTTYYSELPHEGETEIWEIVNLTADAHPIHPHLVAFQILNRETFNFKGYNALYNASFPGGVYIPGYGPPLDYNTSGNQACPPGTPVRGALPLGCVLGGNPDITPFRSLVIQPPLAAEQGWKDTAISYPGEVLRLIVRFAPTGFSNTTLADNLWYDFNPNGGHGYVWHCHIIDHEDNEMMRPFSVVSNPNPLVVRTKTEGIDY